MATNADDLGEKPAGKYLVVYGIAKTYSLPTDEAIKACAGLSERLAEMEIIGGNKPLLMIRMVSQDEWTAIRIDAESKLGLPTDCVVSEGYVITRKGYEHLSRSQKFFQGVGAIVGGAGWFVGALGIFVGIASYWVTLFGIPWIDVRPESYDPKVVVVNDKFDANFVVYNRATYGDSKVRLIPLKDDPDCCVTLLSTADDIPWPDVAPGKSESIPVRCLAVKRGICSIKGDISYSGGELLWLWHFAGRPNQLTQTVEIWPEFDTTPEVSIEPLPKNASSSARFLVTIKNGRRWEKGGTFTATLKRAGSIIFQAAVEPLAGSISPTEPVPYNDGMNHVLNWKLESLPAVTRERYDIFLTEPNSATQPIDWNGIGRNLTVEGQSNE